MPATQLQTQLPAKPFSLFDLLKEGKTLFTLHYMAKHKPHEGIIVAADFNEAKMNGDKYCKSFGLKYLSVTPFLINTNAAPPQLRRETEEIEREDIQVLAPIQHFRGD